MEKKKATFNIDPQVMKDLKYLALDQDKTLTDLFTEAIELLFKKYKKKSQR